VIFATASILGQAPSPSPDRSRCMNLLRSVLSGEGKIRPQFLHQGDR
jgi:hypothetical protein